LSIGVIGEYIAKIYMESKGRPRFHVDMLMGTAFQKGSHSQVQTPIVKVLNK
jgi:hypothetical protein